MDGILLELTGTVSAASSWQIDEIALPIGPQSIKVTGSINKETMPHSAAEPVVIVDGLSGSGLILGGSIVDDSKSDVELWEDVITPLLELKGHEVTLVCPIVGLNGVYLLESFEPSRDTPLFYSYSMRLTKTSLTVVMVED